MGPHHSKTKTTGKVAIIKGIHNTAIYEKTSIVLPDSRKTKSWYHVLAPELAPSTSGPHIYGFYSIVMSMLGGINSCPKPFTPQSIQTRIRTGLLQVGIVVIY